MLDLLIKNASIYDGTGSEPYRGDIGIQGERIVEIGTIEKDAKKVIDADEAPFYSSADLARAASDQPDFKNLVAFAEQRLEKVMNTTQR